MAITWLIVAAFLGLSALQFFSSGGAPLVIAGVMLLVLMVFCLLGAYLAWKGFRPNRNGVDEFIDDDTPYDGTDSDLP